MNKYLISFLFMIISFNSISSEEYNFASIENQIVPKIGSLILTEIYKKIGVSITIIPMTSKRANKEACTGALDGELLRIRSYGDDNPTLLRVPTPYYQAETTAFVQRDNKVELNEISDLANYVVIKIKGIKNTENLTAGMPRVQDFNSVDKMMQFLQLGRADIAITSRINGNHSLQKQGITDIIPLETPLIVMDLYHYIHVDNAELVPRIDEVIKEMKLSGELEILINKIEQEILNQQ